MTIRETLHKYLTDHGLWDKEAELVIDAYRKSEMCFDEGRRLNDSIEGYPSKLLAILIKVVRHEAVKWIDAYKPKHFARPLFVDS